MSSEDCSVCRNEAKGNLVNWETADFSVVNMARRDVPVESVCRPARPGSVLVPNRRTFDSLAGLCGKFRGRMTVVRSQEQQAEMSSLFAGSAACNTRAKGYWNGWEDRREEGKFVDHNKERNSTKKVTHTFFLHDSHYFSKKKQFYIVIAAVLPGLQPLVLRRAQRARGGELRRDLAGLRRRRRLERRLVRLGALRLLRPGPGPDIYA